jgi:hypothetical protein
MTRSCDVHAGVRARVLSVDTETQRLSLGLKPSYFEGEEDDVEEEGEEGLPEQAEEEGNDLDADALEAVDETSEDDADWRTAAARDDGIIHRSGCPVQGLFRPACP